MEVMDLESFRSRYSDITVTAVPAKRDNVEGSVEKQNAAAKTTAAIAPPHVEIIPIARKNATVSTFAAMAQPHKKSAQQKQHKLAQDAIAYANEYRQVLAKLEYTKYVQAQLQMMALSNGINAFDPTRTGNIVGSYTKLLGVISDMHYNLGPSTIGLRAPKERLLRDIAHARVLVRECMLILMNEQHRSLLEER